MIAILMMSANIATVGLLKIKDEVKVMTFLSMTVIFVYDVTNEILSRESNYIVDVIIWPKLGNSSISIKKLS